MSTVEEELTRLIQGQPESWSERTPKREREIAEIRMKEIKRANS